MEPKDYQHEDNAVFSVSDFVAVFNQTLEFAYPRVIVEGELANFRVSKNKWVYFDIKDADSTVRCFGTVYHMPGPLEDGMLIRISAQPRLHTRFNFSLNIQSIQPIGKGSIKKAQALLEAKLRKEGLFEFDRKRSIAYPPQKIALIASGDSAAYHDFMKVLNVRWSGLEIVHANVQVQGDAAIGQIQRALDYVNNLKGVEAVVLTRGGGSPEDLAVFSTEQVTRAVAASKAPTMVAVGHEVDVSLAELAADVRASTPSNAAELLVPDKKSEFHLLGRQEKQLGNVLVQAVYDRQRTIATQTEFLTNSILQILSLRRKELAQRSTLLNAFNPAKALGRGFAIVRSENKVVRSVSSLSKGNNIVVELADGHVNAIVNSTKKLKQEKV